MKPSICRMALAYLGLGALLTACGGTSGPEIGGTGGTGGQVGTGSGGSVGSGGQLGTGSGGIPGASGGAPGSGGATTSTGGRSAGTGGAPAGTGGRSAGTGGVSAGTGGAATGTGGASGPGAGGAGAPTAGCGKAGAVTGQFQAMITAAGLQRGYYVAIPTPYDPNVQHALVFGYHGSNYTGKMMRTYLDMEKAPLVSKAVYIYPDGLPPADNPGKAWDSTAAGMDMPFFDAMLAQMQADYCIDPKRIFVAGQSYGGLMTNAVGCLRGDVVRAIAAIAGSGPNNASQCRGGPVAAWITHGMDDTNVSYASGEKSRDFWLMRNGCTTTTAQGTPMQCQNYQGCMPGYPVIWCPHNMETGHQEPAWGRVAVREFFAGF